MHFVLYNCVTAEMVGSQQFWTQNYGWHHGLLCTGPIGYGRICMLLTNIVTFASVCLCQVNGRSLAHLSQRDALQFLAATQNPITTQIKGQRITDADRGTWEPLPFNLQHLTLPLPLMGTGLNASSHSYQDRYTQL